MGSVVVFVLGLAVIAGVLVALARANRTDATGLAAALGLTVTSERTTAKGDDPVKGRYVDQPIARGRVNGWDLTLARRTVFRTSPKVQRNRSLQTVLVVALPRPPRTLVRVEPARTGALGATVAGALPGAGPATDWPVFATGDPAFDATYRASAPDPAAAVALLSPTVRAALLAARDAATGSLPANAAGRATGDLIAPTFAVEADRAVCTCNGTPTAKLTATLQGAVGPLLHLAHAATAPPA